MQTTLVLICFCIALGYLLKKFVWNPIAETINKPKNNSVHKAPCGSKGGCGCH